jgi:hypothetical protein
MTNVQEDPRISAEVSQQVSVSVESGLDFVDSAQIETAATDAGLDAATTAALVDDYESAQLQALKTGLLVAAFLALGSLATTRGLPSTVESVASSEPVAAG